MCLSQEENDKFLKIGDEVYKIMQKFKENPIKAHQKVQRLADENKVTIEVESKPIIEEYIMPGRKMPVEIWTGGCDLIVKIIKG